jgi:CDP-diacylglycerol--serine O-phosphatidyltransferase
MARRRGPSRPPRTRLKGLSINRLLPNVLTTLSLIAGLTAVRFAILDRWEPAVIAILVAAVLDGLDGAVARLLNGASKFGAQLDSLADFVSFGIAPALVLYLWVLEAGGRAGWFVALAFAICAALRLARFNVQTGESDLPPYAFNYFTGVPAPAGAGLVLLPMIVEFQLVGDGPLRDPAVVGVWTLVVAALFISRWPTFSIKKLRIPVRLQVPVLAGVALAAAALFTAPWPTMTVLGAMYLISLPISLRQFTKLKRQAEALRDPGP